MIWSLGSLGGKLGLCRTLGEGPIRIRRKVTRGWKLMRMRLRMKMKMTTIRIGIADLPVLEFF